MAEIKMPEAGFSVPEGTVLEWYKTVGDPIQAGENLVRVETDKVTVDIPAESPGVLREIRFRPGEVVVTGSVMGVIEEGAAAGGPPVAPVVVQPAASGGQAARQAPRRISPAAKAAARVRGIDPQRIAVGSGPGGRIVKEDVLDHARRETAGLEEASGSSAVSPVTHTPSPPVGPQLPLAAGGLRVDFLGWRRVIADRMQESFREIPHYTMSLEADVAELTRLIGRQREKHPHLHLTYLTFMIKALAAGVREVPQVNSHADRSGYAIRHDVNVGVAVDLGEKLVVPVVRDVQAKSILEIAGELVELVGRARTDRLEPRDVDGGTITLTNVGQYGTVDATSIILPPQVAIVYMGAAREVPAIWEGKIEVRRRMVFGGTFDHRVVNGAAGGRFLARTKDCLEDLSVLLMQLK